MTQLSAHSVIACMLANLGACWMVICLKDTLTIFNFLMKLESEKNFS